MSWIDRLLGHEASASDSTELVEVSATDAQAAPAAGPARIKTPAPFLSKRALASLRPVPVGIMVQGTARRRPQ